MYFILEIALLNDILNSFNFHLLFHSTSFLCFFSYFPNKYSCLIFKYTKVKNNNKKKVNETASSSSLFSPFPSNTGSMTYIRGEHFGSSLAWVLTPGSLLLYGFITINFCSKLKIQACITFQVLISYRLSSFSLGIIWVLPLVMSEPFTWVSTTPILAGLWVGAQAHLAGVPALESAEDPGDTFLRGKGELAPLELQAATGYCFFPATWQCRRAWHTGTAWGGTEKQPQVQMP